MNKFIGSISIFIILTSCGWFTNKQTEINCPTIKDITELFSEKEVWRLENLEERGFRLDLFNSKKHVRESYYFRANGSIKKYAFHNLHYQKPIFEISYDNYCEIDTIIGKSVYVNYKKSIYAQGDSAIEFYINLANPFSHTASVKINKISDKGLSVLGDQQVNGNVSYLKDENIIAGKNKYIFLINLKDKKGTNTMDSVQIHFDF